MRFEQDYVLRMIQMLGNFLRRLKELANDAEKRDAVVLKSSPVDAAERSFTVEPCGFLLLECRRDAAK